MSTGHRALVWSEYLTGAAAAAGGMALLSRPDGSLLGAKQSALAESPFSDWWVPGILLASLVGGGFLFAAECQRRRLPHARELSMVAGVGLIVFEIAELAWIGFQPLELVFAGVGAAVASLAACQQRSKTHVRRL